jgi:hypothetical protein
VIINGTISIVVVAVNWDDSNPDPISVTYDLVANHIAFSIYDTCTVQDIWDGSIKNIKGGPFEMGMLLRHQNVAKIFKCSPF